MLEPSWTKVISAPVTPSAFQAAIFDFVLHGQGDGLINAVAGAGKTWTLLQAARILGQFPGTRRATFAAGFREYVWRNSRKGFGMTHSEARGPATSPEVQPAATMAGGRPHLVVAFDRRAEVELEGPG